MGALAKIVRWIGWKIVVAGLIAGLVIGGAALWMSLRDNIDFEARRRDELRSLTAERSRLRQALVAVNERLAQDTASIASEEERVRQANKVIAQLKALDSTWDRVTGDAQQKENTARRAKLEQANVDSTAKIAALQIEYKRSGWERDGLEIDLKKVETQLATVESKNSKVRHYLQQVWRYRFGRFPVGIWVFVALGAYVFGPTLAKFVFYFLLAPLIVRGRPVRLTKTMTEMPGVGLGSASIELTLQPKEKLWVRKKYLDMAEQGLKKEPRLLLNWRMPLSWRLSGLTNLTELQNWNPLRELSCTLVNRAGPHAELAVVTLRPEVRMIVRPSFIVGVTVAEGERLKVRRRWRPFHLQAWMRPQFRYLEFHGPCRLVVAGNRGVQAEWLMPKQDSPVAPLRVHPEANAGFSPNADFRLVRSQSFWSYYLGRSPLFDDEFATQGMFVRAPIVAEGEMLPPRKFWSNVRVRVLKFFGL